MRDNDVVVIDDDASIRFFLKELLSSYNISCRGAEDGQQGLKLISESRPRLAILDVKMGSLTGLEVAQKIIALSPFTRIVFMTGYSSSVTPEIAGKESVLAVIQKPFDVDAFMNIVLQALE